jgi:hypothetical protein
MQCAPAFNYARDAHVTTLIDDDSISPETLLSKKDYEGMLEKEWGQHLRTNTGSTIDSTSSDSDDHLGATPNANPLETPEGHEPVPEKPHKKALFESPSVTMDLRYVGHAEDGHGGCNEDDVPDIELNLLDLSKKGHKGLGVEAEFELKEGQGVTFIFRIVPGSPLPEGIAKDKKTPTIPPPSSVEAVKQAAKLGVAPEGASGQGGSVGFKVDMNLTVRDGSKKAFVTGIEAGLRAGSKNGRRAPDDPWLTKDLVASLLQVSYPRRSRWTFQLIYRLLDYEQVLVRLDSQVDVHWIMEGVCSAICVGAQAPHFRAYWCCGRIADL